jgi:hypothetical protein
MDLRKHRQSAYFFTTAIIVVLIGVWGITASPSGRSAETADEAPAHVEHMEGSEISRVLLTQRAAERLDIQTGQATDETINGVVTRIIPYSAVIYDANGNAWTYTNPEPLVYVRAPITIDRIEGERAILIDGPAAGTVVVTVGGALLFGTEFGVGH